MCLYLEKKVKMAEGIDGNGRRNKARQLILLGSNELRRFYKAQLIMTFKSKNRRGYRRIDGREDRRKLQYGWAFYRPGTHGNVPEFEKELTDHVFEESSRE